MFPPEPTLSPADQAPGSGPSPLLGVPSPPVPPPAPLDRPPQPLPPTITADSKLRKRPASDDITNPFERQAQMIVEAADDHAKRLAGNLSEQPADSTEADPQTVHEMMHFSKYGVDAPRVFWQVHDRIVQEAVAAGDPDPYAAGERGALDEVYPYRAKLALLDVLGPDERVSRADELMRISERQVAKGSTVESMPFHTGPRGLPAQAEPAQNGGGY